MKNRISTIISSICIFFGAGVILFSLRSEFSFFFFLSGGLLIVIPLMIMKNKFKRSVEFDKKTYEWYKNTYPSNVQGDIVTCSTCEINSLDIRLCDPIISTRTYPDLYTFSVPLSKRTRKLLRKHRKHIAISGVIFASLSISLVLLSLAAKTYVERETIRDYNRIAALKDMNDIEILSKEVTEIHDSFKKIALIFSPFRAVLDNQFYSHPQVHLAGNVIYG